MKIIDAHTHYSNVQAFHVAAEEAGVTFTAGGFTAEQKENNIVASVCMGLVESQPWAFPDCNAPSFMYSNDPAATLNHPHMPDASLRLETNRLPNMYICLGVNPHTLTSQSIDALRGVLKTASDQNDVVGFKIYAGYYHVNINDPIYTPVYQLAAEYNLTVAIHTGDTYAETALLEYSHPLAADRLAVNFRDVNFMLCHMGDPWIMDACEVAYKNRNVYVDISGLQAGDEAHLAATEARILVMQHYERGLSYLNNYSKVLFGTDWPLVPLGGYIEFCKKLVPKEAYEDVFFNNAVKLFNLPRT